MSSPALPFFEVIKLHWYCLFIISMPPLCAFREEICFVYCCVLQHPSVPSRWHNMCTVNICGMRKQIGPWASSLCFLTLVSDIASQCLRSAKQLNVIQVHRVKEKFTLWLSFLWPVYVLLQGLYSIAAVKCPLILFSISLPFSNKIIIYFLYFWYMLGCFVIEIILRNILLYKYNPVWLVL